jgi:hypothetical protein
MTRTVVIHQPDFMPWLGFFHRLIQADLFIVLDHAQFVTGTSRSWMHRDLIKTPAGPKWLTLSVKKAPLGAPIRDIELSPDAKWRAANLNLLRENYRKAPYLGEALPAVEALYNAGHARLVEMALASIDMLSDMLGVQTPRALASQMEPVGANNAMLIDLLQKVGATRYLSGLGARAYLDPELFAKAGIEVIWQDFQHPVYPQLHGQFKPALSALDMLFNCGVRRSKEIMGELS